MSALISWGINADTRVMVQLPKVSELVAITW
jgi:hypothetical protein